MFGGEGVKSSPHIDELFKQTHVRKTTLINL